MEITHELLLGRIQDDPLSHLGTYSPNLLYPYFSGYDDARSHHGAPPVVGTLSLGDFATWFNENFYSGNQGFARVCQLLTDTDEQALELFFEFRKNRLQQLTGGLAGSQNEMAEHRDTGSAESRMSLTEFVLHESLRTRTAMYFANEHWIHGMWAMCNGYLWAERDLGIENSEDAERFAAFQKWVDERYPFAQGKNWGKVIEFLGMGVNERARNEFYDLFETFLEGTDPNEPTKNCREWIETALADVKERQAKGEL